MLRHVRLPLDHRVCSLDCTCQSVGASLTQPDAHKLQAPPQLTDLSRYPTVVEAAQLLSWVVQCKQAP